MIGSYIVYVWGVGLWGFVFICCCLAYVESICWVLITSLFGVVYIDTAVGLRTGYIRLWVGLFYMLYTYTGSLVYTRARGNLSIFYSKIGLFYMYVIRKYTYIQYTVGYTCLGLLYTVYSVSLGWVLGVY
ncbi:hypothetical protein AGDE_17160 [Angomonas deanei]|nr:hypothetical protein AGDE_17160 [Angomonas deanei]|eukprot:EPY15135.1 hypothetical protein AGDE_17160 [Angomonas deanei]